jgi:hypothetical protein
LQYWNVVFRLTVRILHLYLYEDCGRNRGGISQQYSDMLSTRPSLC